MPNTMTKRTPATIRIIVTLSILKSSFFLDPIEHARCGVYFRQLVLRSSHSHLEGLRDSTTGDLEGSLLLNARSATLDQNAQHNDKEYAGNYPDNRYAFHVDPPSSCTRSSTLDAVFNSANSCCVRAILTLRIHKARLQATWRVGYY